MNVVRVASGFINLIGILVLVVEGVFDILGN